MSEHTIDSLVEGWKKAGYGPGNRDGVRARNTSDPVLLAGCYLEWAGGNLQFAIRAVESHCSGQYVDRPRFSGCDATLALLKNLETPNENP